MYRRERRVAREVAARPELFADLCRLLARYDPMGVDSLQEPQEYEYQAGRILLILTDSSTYEGILQNVRAHFAIWFPWADHSPGRFAPLAQEILNVLRAKRDAYLRMKLPGRGGRPL